MANKLLFALLFCSLRFFSSPLFASPEPALIENETPAYRIGKPNADECTAPAPDSFRITSIGSNFISLAWKPAWVGATQTLAVLESDSAGGWIVLYTLDNVPGSAHTVDSLEPGTLYRFIICTNCAPGEPSQLKASIDGITLILELTIAGRVPIQPRPEDCTNIPLLSNWKGFSVEYWDGDLNIKNFFEFVVLDAGGTGSNFFSHVAIARAYEDHPIVAVNEAGEWPTCDVPIRDNIDSYFRMLRLTPTWEWIGWVRLSQNTSNVSICPMPVYQGLQWNNAYSFTALRAREASALPGCDQLRSEKFTTAHGNFKAQNPFDETLRVFFPPSYSGSGKATIRLLNTKGQKVMEQQIEMPASEISFPVSRVLASGVYILQIETEAEMQSIKVVKSE